MTNQSATSPEQINVLAHQVLTLLYVNSLTITQVHDVLNEAERLTNAYAAHVFSTTLFQPDVAKQRLGGTTAYTPKASVTSKALLNQSELGVQGVNQVTQHGHGG